MNEMWNDFGEYVSKLIDEDHLNVAELAIGHFYELSEIIEKYDNINLIKTDIKPTMEDSIKDDLKNPNYELYKDIDLMYSIRPPNELQPYIFNLAKEIKCQLIIKPLTGENLSRKLSLMKLKNYKKASFYFYDFR